MKYIPNPKVTIAPSSINGLGAFAAEDIKKGEDLGFTHVSSPIKGLFPQDMIRIEWGSRINHGGEDANLDLTQSEEITLYEEHMGGNPIDVTYYKAFAKRDIKKGEELTSNYGDDGANSCPCGITYVNEL
jgi:SET domain-containing protein